MKNNTITELTAQQGIKLNVFVIILCLLPMLMINACSSVSAGKETGGPAKEKVKETVIYPMDPFIVNIIDNTQEKFMRMALCFELDNAMVAEKAKTRMAEIRDAIIMIVSSKTYDILHTPEGRLELKDQIKLRAEYILGEKFVHEVYITDFIVQ